LPFSVSSVSLWSIAVRFSAGHLIAEQGRTAGVAILVWLALLAASCAPAAAQGPRVTASVDQQTCAIGDPIQYSLSFYADSLRDLPQVELGALNGFEIVGKQSSQSIINGQVQFDWVYTLVPRQAGSLTIPPATVRYGSTQSRTRPIKIEVSGVSSGPAGSSGVGNLPPVPTGGVEVKLSVDKPNPVVGEQVTLTFTLVQGVSMYGSVGFEPPTAEGCVIEQLPVPDTQRLVAVDREVVVIKRQWALFAASPGVHIIRPAAITFRREMRADQERLESKPVTIDARALPPSPAGYSYGGAVGQFKVQAHCDKPSVKAGEGVTLTVTVTGTGNVSSLEAPKPVVPAWCKVYPAGEKRDVAPKIADGRPVVTGTATFSYLLVPREAGVLRIESVPLVTFDTNTRQYQVAKTAPVSISITPGDVMPDQDNQFGEIAGIKTGLGGLFGHTPLLFRPWFLIFNALPLLVLAAVLIQRAKELAATRDPAFARFTRAGKRAHRRIDSIRGTGKPALGELETALRCYLADKLNLPEKGLLVDDLRRILLERGVDADFTNRATDTLEELQEAHFAPWDPSSMECAEDMAKVKSLIAEAEDGRLIGGG